MRLRRETGDFSIKINYTDSTSAYDNAESIPAGLSAEDLIGTVVEFYEKGILTHYSIVSLAMPYQDEIEIAFLSTRAANVVPVRYGYNPTTGAIKLNG